MRLKDQVIVVTGSTAGIGEAMARRFIAEGASVLIHGRDKDRGQALAAELGRKAAFHADDIADPLAPDRLVAAALKAFGKIDSVVNNAAWIVRSNIAKTNAEFFDKVMATNVRAPLLMIKASLPHLQATRGAVLNIGSINGYCGEANQLDYSISKGALITLSRNLADSLGMSGVRVNHFNVGWVLSPNEYKLKMSEGLPADWPTTLPKSAAPAGRMTMPEDIAAAAVYWVGHESRPISGTVLELEQYPMIGRNPVKEGN